MSSPDRPDSAAVAPDFELPNVGVGPDPLSLDWVVETVDFAVLLLLRDYHCPKCKQQVQTLAAEARQFSELDAVVLPVLPEPVDRAETWQARFDLPFPARRPGEGRRRRVRPADAVRRAGEVHDPVGRLPETVIPGPGATRPRSCTRITGASPGDRPAIETIADEIDQLQESFVFDCTLVDC